MPWQLARLLDELKDNLNLRRQGKFEKAAKAGDSPQGKAA